MQRPLYKARRRRFLVRGELPVDVWFDRFFAPAGLPYHATLAVTERLARCLKCHPTNFRPDDAFEEDFGLPKRSFVLSLDTELEEFDQELDDWLGTIARTLDRPTRCRLGAGFARVRTVADLVRCCEAYLTKQPAVAGRRDEDI